MKRELNGKWIVMYHAEDGGKACWGPFNTFESAEGYANNFIKEPFNLVWLCPPEDAWLPPSSPVIKDNQ